jgi:hypothetical protein
MFDLARVTKNDDLEVWGGFLGTRTLLTGRPTSFDEIKAGYEAVTREDIQAVARKIFSRRPAVVILGPQKDVPGYAEILGYFDLPKPHSIVASNPAPGLYTERPRGV